MTDDELEALLRAPTIEPPLADEGFTARVMRRVRAEEAALLDAQTALAALQARDAVTRRGAHWRWLGTAAGAVVAVAPLAASGLPALQPAHLLALVLAAAAAAWALAAPALREAA
jgi:anti-sigma-K factor RskA